MKPTLLSLLAAFILGFSMDAFSSVENYKLCQKCGNNYRVHSYKMRSLKMYCNKDAVSSIFKVTMKNGERFDIYGDYMICDDILYEQNKVKNDFPEFTEKDFHGRSENGEDYCYPRVSDKYDSDPICWVYNIDFKKVEGAQEKYQLTNVQIYPNRKGVYIKKYKKTESVIVVENSNRDVTLEYPYDRYAHIFGVYIEGPFNDYNFVEKSHSKTDHYKVLNSEYKMDTVYETAEKPAHYSLTLNLEPGSYPVNFVEVRRFLILDNMSDILEDFNFYNNENSSSLNVSEWFETVKQGSVVHNLSLWQEP